MRDTDIGPGLGLLKVPLAAKTEAETQGYDAAQTPLCYQGRRSGGGGGDGGGGGVEGEGGSEGSDDPPFFEN